jgi:thymidylate synthase (FAD)
MGKSRYEVVAKLVWDGGDEVRIPEELGTPRDDQMRGTPGERLSELSGRVCYDSLGKGRSSYDYHKHIKGVGHFSVYEHHQITVFVGNEKLEGGRFLQARTLVNRPGIFVRFGKDGTRLTFNPRVLLDWDQWNDPEDPDALWLKDVLLYYAEQDWTRITPCEAFRTAENCTSVALCSRRMAPDHDEEKWVSMFIAGSRGMTHEIVRHGDRTAISQRSTRFVDEDGSLWIDHPLVQEFLGSNEPLPEDPGDRIRGALKALIEDTKSAARATYAKAAEWLQRWLALKGTDKLTARKQARGAARGYLGNALYTELVFSASVAQWKRMLRLRCSDGADGEIRAVFVEVLKELKQCQYAQAFEAFDLVLASDGVGHVASERKPKGE